MLHTLVLAALLLGGTAGARVIAPADNRTTARPHAESQGDRNAGATQATGSAHGASPALAARASAGAIDPAAVAARKPGIARGDVVTVAELAARLAKPGTARPLLIHMGFRRLFRGGHIPGSAYVGAASSPEGLAGLRQAVKDEKRDREIVLYCGCCPWEHCPNVVPAIRELRRLGFAQARVLYLPKDFWADWVDSGHPFSRQDAPD